MSVKTRGGCSLLAGLFPHSRGGGKESLAHIRKQALSGRPAGFTCVFPSTPLHLARLKGEWVGEDGCIFSGWIPLCRSLTEPSDSAPLCT